MKDRNDRDAGADPIGAMATAPRAFALARGKRTPVRDAPARRTSPAAATWRWALAGAGVGILAALLVFAPASWVATAVTRASAGHLTLALARGPWWDGDAVVVLSAGAGSREAWTLPGRLAWTLGLDGVAPVLSLSQPCCLAGRTRLHLRPGVARLGIILESKVPTPAQDTARRAAAPAPVALAPGGTTGAPPRASAPSLVGQWPAAWLAALGTPWNTLKPDGLVRLTSDDAQWERVEGRWRMAGSLAVDFQDIASSLSTLPALGSYRLELRGGTDGAITLVLRTLKGPLQLSAQGQWTGGRLRLRGEARADEGHETALDNLLNLIGRRQGGRALIALG